jgi:hypothetical protein
MNVDRRDMKRRWVKIHSYPVRADLPGLLALPWRTEVPWFRPRRRLPRSMVGRARITDSKLSAYEVVFGELPPVGRCTTAHLPVATLERDAEGAFFVAAPRCRDCGLHGWPGKNGQFWTVATDSP